MPAPKEEEEYDDDEIRDVEEEEDAVQEEDPDADDSDEDDEDEEEDDEEDGTNIITEILEDTVTPEAIKASQAIAVEIPLDQRSTKPFLTRYEKTRIIGVRAQQIADGSLPMVPFDKNPDPVELATRELKEKKTPLLLRRKLPGGRYETWKIAELEDNLLD